MTETKSVRPPDPLWRVQQAVEGLDDPLVTEPGETHGPGGEMSDFLDLLQSYHGGGSTAVYAVASSWIAGKGVPAAVAYLAAHELRYGARYGAQGTTVDEDPKVMLAMADCLETLADRARAGLPEAKREILYYHLNMRQLEYEIDLFVRRMPEPAKVSPYTRELLAQCDPSRRGQEQAKPQGDDANSLLLEIASATPMVYVDYKDEEGQCIFCGYPGDKPHADSCPWLRARRLLGLTPEQGAGKEGW